MATLLVAKRDGTVRSRVDLSGRRKLTIGRSTRCDLRLRASSISRRHALLFEHDDAWHLVDTGSTMGVFRGDRRWQHLLLVPDEWARIGPAYLWLERRENDRRSGTTADAELVTFDREPPATTPGAIHTTRTLIEDSVRDDDPILHLADAGSSTLRRIMLSADAEALTIGRDSTCDVVLRDPDASPIQCVLYTEHSGWCLAHAGRARTTRVEGRPTWRVRLGEDRVVRVGNSMLWVEDASAVTAGDEAEETLAGAPAIRDTDASPPPGPAELVRAAASSAFFDAPDDRVATPESPPPAS